MEPLPDLELFKQPSIIILNRSSTTDTNTKARNSVMANNMTFLYTSSDQIPAENGVEIGLGLTFGVLVIALVSFFLMGKLADSRAEARKLEYDARLEAGLNASDARAAAKERHLQWDCESSIVDDESADLKGWGYEKGSIDRW